jgi:hypothetical protein
MSGTKAPHQRLAEVAGAPGYEDCHRSSSPAGMPFDPHGHEYLHIIYGPEYDAPEMKRFGQTTKTLYPNGGGVCGTCSNEGSASPPRSYS